MEELLGALLEMAGEFLIEIFFEFAAEALSGLASCVRQTGSAVSAMLFRTIS